MADKKKNEKYLENKKYKGNSLADALSAVGFQNSGSWQGRKTLANANGINNYTGTAEQNINMLNKLKTGNLNNPSYSPTSAGIRTEQQEKKDNKIPTLQMPKQNSTQDVKVEKVNKLTKSGEETTNIRTQQQEKKEQLPVLKKVANDTDKNVIEQYKSLDNANVLERLFNKDKREESNQKQTMQNDYNQARYNVAKAIKESNADDWNIAYGENPYLGDDSNSPEIQAYNQRYQQAVENLTKQAESNGLSLEDLGWAESSDWNAQKVQEQAENAEAQPIASSVSSIGQGLVNAAQAPTTLINYLTGSKTFDAQDPMNTAGNLRDATRGTVSENIDNPIGRTAYNAGMSLADSLAGSAITGGSGGIPIAMGVYQDSTRRNADKGLNADQINSLGLTSAIAEGAGEQLGLNKAQQIIRGGGSNLLRNAASSAFVNGAQEVATDVINNVADTAIAGEQSDIALQYNQLRQQGLTKEQAAAEVAKGIGMQNLQSFAGGAMAGGVLGAGASMVNRFTNGAQTNSAQTTQNAPNIEDNQTVNNLPNLQDNVENTANNEVENQLASQQQVPQLQQESVETVPQQIPTLQNPNAQQSRQNVRTQEDIDTARWTASRQAQDIKRNIDEITRMYADGVDRTEIINTAKQSVDNFTNNPSDESFEYMMNSVSALNNSMRGTKYRNARYKTVNSYDNDIASAFNSDIDDFYRNAVDGMGTVQQDNAPQQQSQPLNVGSLPQITQPANRSNMQESAQHNAVNIINPIAQSANMAQNNVTDADIANSRYATDTAINRTDLRDEIKSDLSENPETYRVRHNVDTKETADNIYNTNDTDTAVAEFRSMLSKKDPASLPLGRNLANQLMNEGRREEAVQLIRDMSQSLTESGQFTQAAAIDLMKNDPITALRYAQKDIDAINTAGRDKFGKRWNDFSLTENEMNAFQNINPGDSQAISELYNQISQRIAKEHPATMWDKLTEFRKMNMLLNPRTHIRNTVANAVTMPIRSTTDRISAVGQNVAKLFNPDMEVTQSIRPGMGLLSSKDRTRNQVADNIFDAQIADLLNNTNKYSESVKDGVRDIQVFKDSYVGTKIKESLSKITKGKSDSALTGSVLENIRQFDYWLLGEVEDNPFVKMNFRNRLTSYMRAQNITDAESLPQEAIDIAYQEALKATFKDDNKITQLMSSLKKSAGKFGDVVLPFTKTPANLAARSIDYSPVGVYNTISHAVRNKGDVATVMDDLSKNILGSGLILAGVALAKNGLITGSYSDDKDEAAFQKQQGMLEHAINVDGRYYTYDWSQPACTPLIIGTAIWEAIQEDDMDIENALNIATDAGKATFNSWFNLSPLQSVAELFGANGNSYSDDDQAQRIIDVGTDFVQSTLFPSAMGATARANDSTIRQTYDSDSALNTQINTAKSKIPGLSKTLPASYDTWGNERSRSDDGLEAAFAQFVNPGQLGMDKSTPIDSEIHKLYEKTGNKAVFPQKMGYKIGDAKLDAEEYADYQQNVGKKSYEFAKAFIDSSAYEKMDDATKAENLSKLYGLSKAIYENEEYGKEMSSTYEKMYDAYDNYGTDGLNNYLYIKDVADGSTKQSKVFEAVDKASMSVGEKGYFLQSMTSSSDVRDEVADSLGNKGVYYYSKFKLEADSNNNGSVSKDEAQDYLNRQDMIPNDRAYWYDKLTNTKTNPYGSYRTPVLR